MAAGGGYPEGLLTSLALKLGGKGCRRDLSEWWTILHIRKK
jgi:hypothetical protein